MPSKSWKGRKVVKCVSCVSLLSRDFSLLKILSLFLFSLFPLPFLFPFSIFAFTLLSYHSVYCVFFSISRPNSRQNGCIFCVLRTSGKILLSKHLSIRYQNGPFNFWIIDADYIKIVITETWYLLHKLVGWSD